MKILISSVLVDDQAKALRFYTEILGFLKKTDIPVGDFRWLTVVSPEGSNDIELALEPNENPAAKTFQQALFEQGIPATAFFSDDVQAEYERLKELGVAFKVEPSGTGPGTIVVFEDTCGNLIQVQQI